MFGRLKTKNAETRVFTSGKGGKFTVDSDVYNATITEMVAYATGKKDQVQGILELELELPSGDKRTYKHFMTLMSEDGNSTYRDSKTGKEILYEDVSILTEICNITCRAFPEELETHDTMIEIYDFDTKGKRPVQATSLSPLKGQQIKVAILEYEDPVRKQDASGKWVETEETRLKNKIDLVMQAESGKTLKELQAQSETPVAHDTWKEYWSGKVKEVVSKKSSKKTTKASQGSVNIPEITEDKGFSF